jgi:hypothetical protein
VKRADHAAEDFTDRPRVMEIADTYFGTQTSRS